MKEVSESSLGAYLVFKAVDKQEAVAFWSCVGKHKTFLSFILLLKLLGADSQSHTPLLQERGAGFCFPNA